MGYGHGPFLPSLRACSPPAATTTHTHPYSPSAILRFALYEEFKLFIHGHEQAPEWLRAHNAHIVAGALAGAISSAVTTPLDVVKTRVRTPRHATPRYATPKNVVLTFLFLLNLCFPPPPPKKHDDATTPTPRWPSTPAPRGGTC